MGRVMEKYFALINKGLVESVIVANDDFLDHIKDKHELILDVTYRDRPSVGDSYYKDMDIFVSNRLETHHIPVDLKLKHLNQGTEKGFEPFQISKYTVSYADGMIQIGCKKYSAPGFLDALHRFLIKKEQTVHCFTVVGKPGHGKFEVTWDDMQKLYDALSKVKF